MKVPLLRRSIQDKFSAKADAIAVVKGMIGDGEGRIETGTPNKIYCRVGDQVIETWAYNIPHTYNMTVYLVKSSRYPGDMEVLSTDMRVNAMAGLTVNNAAPHGRDHGWMERDPVFMHLRQFLPLWIGTTGNAETPYTIQIGGGLVWTGAALAEVVAQKMDLAAYLPAGDTSGNRYCCYVLLSIDNTGAVVATAGTAVLEASFGLDSIPEAPAGTVMVLGAVRLYSDQVAIAEARDRTDIIDMRYPYRHTHLGSEVGGHDPVTVVNGATVDLALTGQQLTAEVIQSALDPANMGSGAVADGQYLAADGAGGAEWRPPVTHAFTELTDVPAAYTGHGGQYVRVVAGENGLEFVELSGGGDMLRSTYDPDLDGSVALADAINGVDAAGALKYYGTNSGGEAGFHTLPEGGSGTGATDVLMMQVFS